MDQLVTILGTLALGVAGTALGLGLGGRVDTEDRRARRDEALAQELAVGR